MSIEFVSVADYPNGYQLSNDELEAIHAVMQIDQSCNYEVREVGTGTRDYHLEVTATYQDEEIPPGPVYTIADGIITKLPKTPDWTDTLDGLDPTELRSLGQAAFEKAFWLDRVATADS